MTLFEKFSAIVDWQRLHIQQELGGFSVPIDENQVQLIENLIGESIPTQVRLLYQYSNGQMGGNGLLFGGNFIDADEIIQSLTFSKKLIKPRQRTIPDEQKAIFLLDQIRDFYINRINQCKKYNPRNWFFQRTPIWHKIEFSCSPHSLEGPYIYFHKNSQEYDVFRIDNDAVFNVVTKLWHIEQHSYNWDQLNFVIYPDSHYTVERTDLDFDEATFTSFPHQAIKSRYFYYKWLPLFSDGGGNYIGVDLDPDVNGHKGQIINFGRDEQHMSVLARDLDHFFDAILQLIADKKLDYVNDLEQIYFIDFLKEQLTQHNG